MDGPEDERCSVCARLDPVNCPCPPDDDDADDDDSDPTDLRLLPPWAQRTT